MNAERKGNEQKKISVKNRMGRILKSTKDGWKKEKKQNERKENLSSK